ncbi:STAS domain-containing protein [Celeribacter sp.]|uniref:STAS domain-containing protein n=1 Tax=Celeribacter sp. TaxID=1890673 RepID=UPI003A93D9DC
MKLTHRDFDDIRVISVDEARIDAACAIQFKDQMREKTDDAPSRVVLDLGRVAFLDSSGLGAVVAAMKAMKDGHRLELAALNPPVQRVFHLTRMDNVFRIHPSIDTVVPGDDET